MDTKLKQGLEWLEKEMKKDDAEIIVHKQKLIDEILKIDKSKMFEPPKPKKKLTFFQRLLIFIGYGKK